MADPVSPAATPKVAATSPAAKPKETAAKQPAKAEQPPPAFTYVELFAGIGGFGVACRALGGSCVFASEIEPSAKTAWAANFADKRGVLKGDITKVPAAQIPAHDILVGGFPCQPFSRAGEQPATADPEKGLLYREIVKILREKRPAMLLLENVPGLATAEGGAALRQIIAEIESAGYEVQCAVIDSAVVLPQSRKRLYLVGFRVGGADPSPRASSSSASSPVEPAAPTATETTTDSAARRFEWPQLPDLRPRRLREILQPDADTAAFKLLPEQWAKRLGICPDRDEWLADLDAPGPTLTRGYRKAPGKAAGKRAAAKSAKLREAAAANATAAEAVTAPGSPDASRPTPAPADDEAASRRATWRNLVPVPLHGGNGGNATARYLTAREGARMQGFPESFVIPMEARADGPGIALMGNAVSVPVIAALVAAMLPAAGKQQQMPRHRAESQEMAGAAVAAAPTAEPHAVVAETLLAAVPEGAVRDELKMRIDAAPLVDAAVPVVLAPPPSQGGGRRRREKRQAPQ